MIQMSYLMETVYLYEEKPATNLQQPQGLAQSVSVPSWQERRQKWRRSVFLSPQRSALPWCWSPAGWTSLWAVDSQGSWAHVGGSLKRWYKQMFPLPAPPGWPGLELRTQAEPPSRWCRWRCLWATSWRKFRYTLRPIRDELHSGPASQPGWTLWCSCGWL